MEISGFYNCVRAPGFLEAAVAPSTTAIKALPCAIALAPEPVGSGTELIFGGDRENCAKAARDNGRDRKMHVNAKNICFCLIKISSFHTTFHVEMHIQGAHASMAE
ncbi:hypothetical protein KsCSTR_10390 [Candidatus Kuenenia stuttgartiensis]|jgi:hypothetical protein|uniref:Uncharacterized protein n=1 Tax=Kuenenia stuttgartiensis TaxID=174633 RepID=Q1PYQ2_KUEST|nr:MULTISPECIES: hypothetical protein [Kuenenia]MBW7941621.1 hypothetical protein [Candidatus Kuenenia stuttgartiensis]MCZ7624253.1 hypothetical protein [Candidatus Kuenenia sp.]QII10418.1 hypothetical protein KsCSTR_10390 [Candidatus Kuenenia stuttgartiensis]CAJ72219.1 unknown protein [Candidatus Kuenenia stuttgartiensis]SOH03772.1 hypothetical protein KSMBR1_1270 [Candidatus Kuenenia stuttgartiensis]